MAPVSGHHAGVVPANKVAMDTSLLGLNLLRLPTNLDGISSQFHLLAMSLGSNAVPQILKHNSFSGDTVFRKSYKLHTS